jgi:hypothetical protein
MLHTGVFDLNNEYECEFALKRSCGHASLPSAICKQKHKRAAPVRTNRNERVKYHRNLVCHRVIMTTVDQMIFSWLLQGVIP